MNKIDILYLAHNREAFTKKTLELLLANTDWSLVSGIWLYDDASSDASFEMLCKTADAARKLLPAVRVELITGTFGNPVAIMVDYLKRDGRAAMFAKVDNDTALPAGWLNVCMDVMERNPELDLLGIEALDGEGVPADHIGRDRADVTPRRYYASSHIGGIGLMRARAFTSLPRPSDKFFGFTHWQNMNPQVSRGFLTPSLPVALLDHVPAEPWITLTREYVAKGWSRAWREYGPHQRHLWEWLE